MAIPELSRLSFRDDTEIIDGMKRPELISWLEEKSGKKYDWSNTKLKYLYKYYKDYDQGDQDGGIVFDGKTREELIDYLHKRTSASRGLYRVTKSNKDLVEDYITTAIQGRDILPEDERSSGGYDYSQDEGYYVEEEDYDPDYDSDYISLDQDSEKVVEDYKARINFDQIENEDIKKIIKDFPLIDPKRIQENMYNNIIPFDERKYKPYQSPTMATPQMTKSQVRRGSQITHLLDSDYLITTKNNEVVIKHELEGLEIPLEPLRQRWAEQSGHLLEIYRDEGFGVHNEWKNQPDVIDYEPQDTPWEYDPSKNYRQIQEDRKSRSPDESFENVEITDGMTREEILNWLGNNTDNTRSTYTKNSNSALKQLYDKFKGENQEDRKSENLINNKSRSEVVEFIENNIEDVLGQKPQDYSTYTNSSIVQIYENIKNQLRENERRSDDEDSDSGSSGGGETLTDGKTRAELVRFLVDNTGGELGDYRSYSNSVVVDLYETYKSNNRGSDDEDSDSGNSGEETGDNRGSDDEDSDSGNSGINTQGISSVTVLLAGLVGYILYKNLGD